MLAEIQGKTKLTIHVHYYQDKAVVGHDVFEGEVTMTQPQQDSYKQLLGDEKASVTASKELSESDYGNGGKVFVSVSLTIDQSQGALESGIAWAKMLADQKAWEHHAEMKQQLVQRGILKS